MLIVFDTATGEILDNTGTSTMWPDGPPDEFAYVNTDARGVGRARLGLLRLNDIGDAALVARVLAHECNVVDGRVVIGEPHPVPDPSPVVERPASEAVAAATYVARTMIAERVRGETFPLADTPKVIALFPDWAPDLDVTVGRIYTFNGELVECVQSHTTQADWTPDVTPALWKIHRDPDVAAEWVQPTGSTDAYPKGAKVTHNDATWTSDVDANVWEPGVYGWTAS